MVVVLVVGIINKIPYVEKFWSGKKLANLANRMPFANFLPVNHFPFAISCSYTGSSFANILPSNWFGLAHSPIFSPPKFPMYDILLNI